MEVLHNIQIVYHTVLDFDLRYDFDLSGCGLEDHILCGPAKTLLVDTIFHKFLGRRCILEVGRRRG